MGMLWALYLVLSLCQNLRGTPIVWHQFSRSQGISIRSSKRTLANINAPTRLRGRSLVQLAERGHLIRDYIFTQDPSICMGLATTSTTAGWLGLPLAVPDTYPEMRFLYHWSFSRSGVLPGRRLAPFKLFTTPP
jgi:hypothetical protein